MKKDFLDIIELHLWDFRVRLKQTPTHFAFFNLVDWWEFSKQYEMKYHTLVSRDKLYITQRHYGVDILYIEPDEISYNEIYKGEKLLTRPTDYLCGYILNDIFRGIEIRGYEDPVEKAFIWKVLEMGKAYENNFSKINLDNINRLQKPEERTILKKHA